MPTATLDVSPPLHALLRLVTHCACANTESHDRLLGWAVARSQGDVDLLEFITWVQHMAATPTGVSASMVWFYKEQAAQGNSAAILNLAICNLSGVGMLQNAEEGVRLLKDAAGRGNAMAVRAGGSTHTRAHARTC